MFPVRTQLRPIVTCSSPHCPGSRLISRRAVLLGVCMLLLTRPLYKALSRPAKASVQTVRRIAMAAEDSYTYKWPRPSVTVDAVIVGQPEGQQQHARVLLIKRKHPPFEGYWALPGGFVDENESLEHAAARELQEETSLDAAANDILLTQVGAFGDPGRDPRGWCISVAFAALVPSSDLAVRAADDAAEAEWHDVLALPAVAFDHKLILRTAFRHLAREDRVQGVEGLRDQLRRAADLQEGPWQHTEGEKQQ